MNVNTSSIAAARVLQARAKKEQLLVSRRELRKKIKELEAEDKEIKGLIYQCEVEESEAMQEVAKSVDPTVVTMVKDALENQTLGNLNRACDLVGVAKEMNTNKMVYNLKGWLMANGITF